ncbi:EAL domain-containing protein [Alteromonas sp. 5E99-2]|uniref:bifunctional diguanylate cyclase/phosphodiesterase n=1 Tax=Alteromonas sp. 5E99-2 TaxID=2817683 RepID=UPI001A99AB9C|nr:GGDEF domain-containing protein [Alteromonas sp. 5E99-2]MBO1256737.1 EAL domain-containing protein [Alteromonas sp. 5E99-2]
MRVNSLNHRIFRLVVGAVLLTFFTIIVTVWLATSEQANKRLERDLDVAQKVLQQELINRENRLFDSTKVLTADFGFKQAVATQDKGTIDSALLNFGNRINADVMALVSLQGSNIASIPMLLESDSPFPFQTLTEMVIQEGSASAFIVLKDEPYQVILLTVDAPAPIAIAVVGFKLNADLTNQLKSITQLDTTIQAVGAESTTYSVSTLCEACLDNALAQMGRKLNWFSVTVKQDIPYISKKVVLSDDYGYTTQIIISEDTKKLFADSKRLQITITLIGFAAILLAMLLGGLLTKRLATPLATLAQLAHRISTGDYSKAINDTSNTLELKQLSSTFNTMQKNIQAREDKIIFQAQHDILTSLYNRNHIETLLDKKFRSATPFVAIGINIFGFRGINDSFGYHNGDRCLKILASRVEKLAGLSARLTGGELLWVPDNAPTEAQLKDIKSALEKPIDTGDVEIDLTVALGILTCPQHSTNAEDLFKRMNIVLDEAQITRQFVLYYDPELEQRYVRRLSIITELKHALAHQQNELDLFYQPKLNLASQTVDDVEALIRWNNEKLGFVSPEDFIAIAEHAGFIEQVTEWVVDRAISDAMQFKQSGVMVTIAVNLSAKDIMTEHLLPSILAKLNENSLAVDSLSFEITEGDLVRDHEKAVAQLKSYKKQGFNIAIDDFGTGYSSMAYLQSLPVNTLKIDKSFVMQLDTKQGDQHIVKTVINLAHSFDMSVVAEGVENQEALNLLKQWGCEWAQGYFISKPITRDQFIEWYKKTAQ